MTCDTALERISASLDGELTGEEEAQLQAHLAQCPRCRALQTELAGLHQAAQTGLDAQAPAELRQRVLENLPPQKPAGSGVYWKRWGAMAAAVAVIALAAWRLPRFLFQHEQSADTTAAVATTEAVEDAVEEAAPQEFAYSNANKEAAPTAAADADSEVLDQVARMEDTVETAGAETPMAPAGGAETADAAAKNSQSEKAEIKSSAARETDAPLSASAEIAENFGRKSPAPSEAPTADGGGGGGGSAAGGTTVTGDAGAVSGGEDDAPAVMRASLAEESAQWLGVLTLDEYTPGDTAVEVVIGQERRYILPADDFLALLRSLEESGAAYELQSEGDDISPDAESGLVILTEN